MRSSNAELKVHWKCAFRMLSINIESKSKIKCNISLQSARGHLSSTPNLPAFKSGISNGACTAKVPVLSPFMSVQMLSNHRHLRAFCLGWNQPSVPKLAVMVAPETNLKLRFLRLYSVLKNCFPWVPFLHLYLFR